MKNTTKKGYSVIISILLIGFLLILTIGVFTLVMKEYNDNKGLGDGIKAFAGAESAQELALLKIKEKGYGIGDKIEHTISTGSIVLSQNPTNTGAFIPQKEAFISYDLNVLAELIAGEYTYSETLGSNVYSIIPLFYEKDGEAITNVENYDLIVGGSPGDLVWNLIAGEEGIGNTGTNTSNGKGKKINNIGESEFIDSTVLSFLPKNNTYLILFNSGNSDINITVKSTDKFSKPKTKILSSAQVGKYRHNLETEYDNTEFLNMLKYAVFSN